MLEKNTKDYVFSVGKRKSAIARVRIMKTRTKGLKVTINDKDYKDYFPYVAWQELVLKPLRTTGQENLSISIKVSGGGKKGQMEAVSHGLARALLKIDEELRATLRKEGLLTRDDRVKERKKPGLKKARRAPQWSKR